MIPDILSLAHDVDRLFRARDDGRQMPVWEHRTATNADGGTTAYRAPCDDEQRALHLLDAVEGGRYRDPEYDPNPWLRTRRHIAMLALTEPTHFQACLAEVKVHRIGRDVSTGVTRDSDVIVHTNGLEIRQQRTNGRPCAPLKSPPTSPGPPAISST